MPRAFKTLGIFAVAGPPLTGIVTALLIGLYGLVVHGGPSQGATPWLQQTLMMAVYALPISYIMGGVQAVAVGVASAAWVYRRGTLPVTVALTLSTAAWLGFSVFLSNLWQRPGMAFSEVAPFRREG